MYANLSSWFDFFSGLFRRHFVHRGNLLSWSMAVEHSFQRDGRPISLEEDGIIHRKGKQWRERERELGSFTDSHREPFNKWSLTCYTHHPSRHSGRHCQRFPSQKLVKNTSTAIGHPLPPLLWENILVASLVIFVKTKRKREGPPRRR